MLTYTPRPGSKTEAAVEYLRTHGGRATAIDIAEAVDTERKNLHAIFAAAIGAGLIEGCTLPDGPGYALCGAGREWSAVPVPAASAAASAGSGSTAAAKPTPDTPKRRGRPQGVPKAEKPRRSPPPGHTLRRNALRAVQRWLAAHRGRGHRRSGPLLRRRQRNDDHLHARSGGRAH